MDGMAEPLRPSYYTVTVVIPHFPVWVIDYDLPDFFEGTLDEASLDVVAVNAVPRQGTPAAISHDPH